MYTRMLMYQMKNKILQLIKDKPKNYSTIIKHSPDLLNWVKQNTLISSNKFAEEIYSAVYQISNICVNGNYKKFLGFSVGFIGCGNANKCACVNAQVSLSVKTSKQSVSKEQQNLSNIKRRITNINKYGVSCVAQTEENKKKFRNWYANPDNVEKNLERIKQTNIAKYGVENCKTLPEVSQKIIATCLARYNVTNVSQIPSTKAKLRARTAEYKLSGHLLNGGYMKFSQYLEVNYDFKLITSRDDYTGTSNLENIDVRCKKCNSEKTVKFHYGRGLNCDICNPISSKFVSKEEQEIFDFISNDLGIHNGEQSNRDIISPFELDMVFHDQKIAIEYCGLYWHSEFSSGKDRNYHSNKFQDVLKYGYQLITIFSDEWNLKNSIVKSKLRNIFKKTQEVYYARKLKIAIVSNQDSKTFQDNHHLQGSSSAKVNLGLYDNQKLLALMTFSNGRAALNSKSVDTEYELVRFVTDGSSVVGGASKLLSHFVKKYNPSKIISYSDNRWSVGALYHLLGFSKINKPSIGYWYVDAYKQRIHRFNFTKQSLIEAGNDPSKSEWEIMKDLGYDRIWDCGHQKFELIYPQILKL